jgi:hypothetical protein
LLLALQDHASTSCRRWRAGQLEFVYAFADSNGDRFAAGGGMKRNIVETIISLEPGGDIEILDNGDMVLFTETALDPASVVYHVLMNPKDDS